LKFIVDESTGIMVSKLLKQMGLDSVSVIDCMKGAEDEDVMKKAIEEDRVIITNDKDFGRLVRYYKPPGVILLRLRDESVENKFRVVSFVIASYEEAILGNVLIVSERKIRVRPIQER
jgi:predicted nuclease of predicted toxin-antitoxin system